MHRLEFEKYNDLIGKTGEITQNFEILDAKESIGEIYILVKESNGEVYWIQLDGNISLD